VAGIDQPPAFESLDEQRAAQLALEAIRKLSAQPDKVPGLAYLRSADVQDLLVREVTEQWGAGEQLEIEGTRSVPNFAAVVTKTSDLVVREMISIPRISVLPKGELKAGFRSFELQLGGLRFQAPSEELWVQHLRTGKSEVVSLGSGGIEEKRLEDHVVSGLVDFSDVAYDAQADLLYGLASQVVQHLRSYLSEEEARRVLSLHQREIARFVHVQMQDHYWEEVVEYDVGVSRGFTELKASAYSTAESTLDFRQSPADKSNMARYLFGGFSRCLYPVEKFHSDTERRLAVILDREAEKWFKPAKGQFQVFYRSGSDPAEYQPDFVAETKDAIHMLEPKARNEMTEAGVIAKRDAAVLWCQRASDHSATCGGKPWIYALIPHDIVADNMTIAGLVAVATGRP
jgi:type III restriction enzyme